MQKLTIIDVTRMDHGNCCIAGICQQEGNRLYRLNTPCTSQSFTREQGIEPGVMFSGSFLAVSNVRPPHIEDCQWHLTQREGFSADADFKKCLESALVDNLKEGLGIERRGTPVENFTSVGRSIVTVKPRFCGMRIGQWDGKPKLKMDFGIGDNSRFLGSPRFLYQFCPVNDFRFYNLDNSINGQVVAKAQACLEKWNDGNGMLDLYLRVGLTRPFKKDDEGEVLKYWLQVDGLHFFRKDTGTYCRNFELDDSVATQGVLNG